MIKPLQDAFTLDVPEGERTFAILEDNPSVVGVSARYDGLWFALWTLSNSMPYQSFGQLDDALAVDVGRSLPGTIGITNLISSLQSVWVPGADPPSRVDTSWECRTWQAWIGRDLAYGIPPATPIVYEIQLVADGGRPSDVLEIVGPYVGPHRVTYSYRSRTRAHLRLWSGARAEDEHTLMQGASIYQEPGYRGTLGGFITSDRGNYCTTANHVASVAEKDVYQSASGAVIGPCVYSRLRTVGDQLMDETALVELPMSFVRDCEPVEIRPAGDVPVGVRMDFAGGTSRAAVAEVYQYVRFRKVKFPQGQMVIRDGFEIRAPKTTLFGPCWRRPSAPGDSGAWITFDGGEGLSWCGSIVGGDSVSTVATFAEYTAAELDGAGHLGLRPYLSSLTPIN